jgi:orotate phosphoribosyltransferase
MTALTQLQSKFLDLLLTSGALKFGEFKTKSGRISPYFINTGAFDHGAVLGKVAECYAHLIRSRFRDGIHLYGPAYKGITLAAATTLELAKYSNEDVPFTFNRKEAKDHGEGGVFVGRALSPSHPVIIIEDVMTGGTSIRETMELLKPRNISVRAVVIGIDRQERGLGSQQASLEVQADFGCPVMAILTIDEIVRALWNTERLGKIWVDGQIKSRIDQYRTNWG